MNSHRVLAGLAWKGRQSVLLPQKSLRCNNSNLSSSKQGEPVPERVTNPKHNPNSASPEPSNAQELFNRSIVDNKGVRSAKDADGVIHRFSAPSNGQSHWNGSTAGVKPIRMDDIPIAIRRAFQ